MVSQHDSVCVIEILCHGVHDCLSWQKLC